MKQLILLFILFLFGLVAMAQKVHVLRNSTDRFTKEKIIEVSYMRKINGGMESKAALVPGMNKWLGILSMTNSRTEGSEYYFFTMKVGGLDGCLDEEVSSIILLLANEETITLTQVSETDCSTPKLFGVFMFGDFSHRENENAYREYQSEALTKLKKWQIVAARVYGSGSYTDYDLPIEKQKMIYQMLMKMDDLKKEEVAD